MVKTDSMHLFINFSCFIDNNTTISLAESMLGTIITTYTTAIIIKVANILNHFQYNTITATSQAYFIYLLRWLGTTTSYTYH
jgi:phenylacetate-coenzyme A ligase PaaK-like adenylate-forming protein